MITLLPTSLLMVRRSQNKMQPVYAELDTTNLEVASFLIDLYTKHVGQKRSSMTPVLSEFESVGHDYRFIRGLVVLLDRNCQLESKTLINPLDIRRQLFQHASEMGLPTTEEARSTILSRVAKELKTDSKELDASLYGDLDDEMTLARFDPIDPLDLLKRYNLSLTQTLLFGASELSFTVSQNWQPIFRQIKWLRLIYTVDVSDKEYWITVDGPTSLFRLTKRYGTSLAKLLPTIFQSASWRITAKVLDHRNNKRLLDLELDSTRHSRYLPRVVTEESYDSKVEADFATHFTIHVKDWELEREPNPLTVGTHVIIPDFLLKKNGLEVYLEIVGFWTPRYLDNKVKKLSMIKEVDMIVAVDKRLACEKLSRKIEHLNLIYYKGTIPLQPILAHLREKETTSVKDQIPVLLGKELDLTTPIADIHDIAEMYHVSVTTVVNTFGQLQVPGYLRIGDMFIKTAFLESIREKLEQRMERGKLSFAEATELIESVGGKNSSIILETLGYTIIWRGINAKMADVQKKGI